MERERGGRERGRGRERRREGERGRERERKIFTECMCFGGSSVAQILDRARVMQ